MIFLVMLISFILLFSPASSAIGVSEGETAPDFTLNSVEGKTISLSKYNGWVVVFIYWRTGHKRSLLALKDGNDVFKKFEGKGVQVVSIIAGSDSQEDAKDIIKENRINYPVFIDSERELYSSYGISVYPTTVIVDKEGILVHNIPGHPPTYKKVLEEYIKKTLGEIDEAGLREALSTHKKKKDKSALEALRLYNLSLQLTGSGMLDLAIDTATRSVKAKPDTAEPHILLGFLYLELKEADKALAAFNKAIALDFHSKDAKTGLGGALILKGDVEEAIEILNTAAIANPYPQMTYYELGKAYELKGEKDRSIEMYKKAIEKIIKKQILPSSISKCK